MKKFLIVYIFLLFLPSLPIIAQSSSDTRQNQLIDSLFNVLKTAKDTTEVNTLNALSKQYKSIANYEQALQYAKQARQKAEKAGFKKGMADAANNVGVAYWSTADYDSALEHFLLAYKLYQQINYKKGMGNSLNNIGLIYWNQGNYEKTLEYYFKSLKIREEIEDKAGVGMSYSNIGNIYLGMGNNEKALDYYFKSLKINEEIGNKYMQGTCLNNIGVTYGNQQNQKKALEYHFKSLKINEEIGDKKAIAQSYNNIGLMNHHLGNYKDALDNHLKALRINKEIGNLQGTAITSNNIGNIYIDQGKFEDALFYNQASLMLCKKMGFKAGILDVYASLSNLFEKKGDYKSALEYHKLQTAIKDSMLNEESTRQIADMNFKYDSEKKDKAIQLLNKEKETQASVAAAESIRQRGILISILIVLFLVIVFTLFVYRSFKQKQRLSEELEKLSIVASETDNGVLICGPNGEIEWSNTGLTRLLGYTFEEMKKRGNTIAELSSNPDIKQVIQQSITNKKTSTYQVLNITKDGKERWIQSTLTPILDRNSNIKKLVIIDTDISERKKFEEQLSKQNEILEEKVKERTAELVRRNEEIEKMYNDIQVLSEIGQEITSTLNLEKVLDTVYKKVNSLMDATEFGVGIYNPQKQSIDLNYYIYESKRMINTSEMAVSMADKNRLSVWCVDNKMPVFINDIQNEYHNYISNLDSYKGEGKLLLESVICLPLVVEDKLVGIISVQSPKKNAYSHNHLDILQTLASYIAIALDNARLYNNMEDEIKVRTKEIEKQKTLVEDKNLKITDSINYALRIQQAILPSQQMISSILPDSFIFFKPKDIVSGDFYWAYALDQHQILVAAVDCTGHGVPGAFMSIMGFNLLEQIVKEQKIHEPALILNELSSSVVRSLKQTDQVGSLKEGMDIALCKIDYRNYELEYAGAHNPLNLVRNGTIAEVKANSRAIGISLANSTPFTNHKLQLEKGDCIYIFSDGYADQKGGPNNRKFFYQPFQQLLLDIHQQNMKEQEKSLERTIYAWKGEREQIDDMLVIGVRV